MKIRGRAETYTPAAWVRRSFPRRGSAGGRSGGGGGGQIKLRREIYGRACNEQLFHGMRTPGLASGGGISIRSSSCRPRASRSPSVPIYASLFPLSFIPRRKEDSPVPVSRCRCHRRCLRPGMTFLPAMHLVRDMRDRLIEAPQFSSTFASNVKYRTFSLFRSSISFYPLTRSGSAGTYVNGDRRAFSYTCRSRERRVHLECRFGFSIIARKGPV